MRELPLIFGLLGPLLGHAENPILPGADPHALVDGKTVWIYPTWTDGPGPCFLAFSSNNLRDWKRHGPPLDFQDVKWIRHDGAERHYAWAPGVLSANGQWYSLSSMGESVGRWSLPGRAPGVYRPGRLR